MSQVKELLDLLVAGNFTEVIPQSRLEACLKNCLAGLGTEGLPPPLSRAEEYLHELAEKVSGGFSGGPVPEMRDFAYLYSGERRLSEIPLEELIPYMRNGTDFTRMFESCKNIPTSMTITLGRGSCDGMFYGCSNLEAIEFTGSGKPTSVSSMFSGCVKLKTITGLDTSECTNFSYTFRNCNAIMDTLSVDTSNGTNFEGMFESCTGKKKSPFINTSKGTNFKRMFIYSYITELAPLDLSNGQNFENMFYSANYLETITPLNIPNATNVRDMFNECSSLKHVPLTGFGKATDLGSIFNRCSSLPSVSGLDFSKVTSMGDTFRECSSLESIYDVDMRSVTYTYTTFYKCTKLTNLYAYNIKWDLTIGAGTTYGHLLTLDSLIHTIKELRDTGSSKTLTMGTTNLEKLTDVYVKLIPITDEMRAADDLIDEKLPFEVCESTDDGAMLITDYVGEKNWVLK